MLLYRVTINIDYDEKTSDRKTRKITGPWVAAILYVIGKSKAILKYDDIIKEQFFEINQYEKLPITEFIDRLCVHFTDYQQRQQASIDGNG